MREVFSIIFAIVFFSLSIFISSKKISQNFISAFSEKELSYSEHTVILDAGHGGEDSGAIAVDGTYEKDINLQICKRLALIFELLGIKYIEIRTEDISVGDTSLDTIRKRKVSDINKRYEIINNTPDSILLSIHQNNFPVEKYNGVQVFYALAETSDILADFIQQSVVNNLQSDNNRKIKQCDNSVFLLNKAKVPSVMVECGFISNNFELSQLKSDSYQLQISYFITKGLINYLLNY